MRAESGNFFFFYFLPKWDKSLITINCNKFYCLVKGFKCICFYGKEIENNNLRPPICAKKIRNPKDSMRAAVNMWESNKTMSLPHDAGA